MNFIPQATTTVVESPREAWTIVEQEDFFILKSVFELVANVTCHVRYNWSDTGFPVQRIRSREKLNHVFRFESFREAVVYRIVQQEVSRLLSMCDEEE